MALPGRGLLAVRRCARGGVDPRSGRRDPRGPADHAARRREDRRAAPAHRREDRRRRLPRRGHGDPAVQEPVPVEDRGGLPVPAADRRRGQRDADHVRRPRDRGGDPGAPRGDADLRGGALAGPDRRAARAGAAQPVHPVGRQPGAGRDDRRHAALRPAARLRRRRLRGRVPDGRRAALRPGGGARQGRPGRGAACGAARRGAQLARHQPGGRARRRRAARRHRVELAPDLGRARRRIGQPGPRRDRARRRDPEQGLRAALPGRRRGAGVRRPRLPRRPRPGRQLRAGRAAARRCGAGADRPARDRVRARHLVVDARRAARQGPGRDPRGARPAAARRHVPDRPVRRPRQRAGPGADREPAAQPRADARLARRARRRRHDRDDRRDRGRARGAPRSPAAADRRVPHRRLRRQRGRRDPADRRARR